MFALGQSLAGGGGGVLGCHLLDGISVHRFQVFILRVQLICCSSCRRYKATVSFLYCFYGEIVLGDVRAWVLQNPD